MSPKSQAIGLVIISALLWSTGGFLVKFIDWDGISIAGSRSLIAALALCLCLRRPPRLLHDKYSRAGVVIYALLVISFVSATKLTTAANAILLQYMAPVYVAIVAPFFLKEPTRHNDWLFIALALCGMALFFMDSLSMTGMQGNLIAVGGGLLFAAFGLLLRKIPAQLGPDVLIWGNILAFVICLPFINFASPPSTAGWLALLAMGCFQLGFSYYLYTKAVAHLSALELILIPTIEPILNPLLVALLIGEIPSKWSIIGGIIVLSTVTMWSISKLRK